MKIKKDPQGIWNEYNDGINYNSSIELYDKVEDAENFVVGNQWEGVNAPDLEKPVLNILKRPVAYYVSTICSEDIGMKLKPFKTNDETVRICDAVKRQMERVIELDRLKAKKRKMVRNACVDGDGCIYYYWDTDVKTGGKEEGDIRSEIVENINVIFGNPHDQEVQAQPYIIIALRKPVAEVREMAMDNGVSKEEAEEKIIADADTNQGEKGGDNDLCTVLVKFWKEDGKIHVIKTTKDCIVREEWEPGTKLYPIEWYRVDDVRKCYHGQGIVTGMIPNQIIVNKLFAMYVRSVQMNAFPKTAYDESKFPNGWSNRVGEAIKVKSGGVMPVTDAFTVIRGGDVSQQVMEVIQKCITLTKECIGATDAALGNVNAERAAASGIMANMQAAQAPLEMPHIAFYDAFEDSIRIIKDLMQAHYGKRMLDVELPKEEAAEDQMSNADPTEPKTEQREFDFAKLDEIVQDIEVHVGSSAYWSELMQMQTMDNLIQAGMITDVIVYLESIPDKFLPNKAKILEQAKRMQQQTSQGVGQQEQQINAIPQLPQQSFDEMLG